MTDNALARQAELVAALLARMRVHGAATLYETHISWVLVQGGDAWKIKKALRLPFLDFSTLEARRHFCDEEVRLNRRLAPGLYLGVAGITGTPGQPRLGGAGTPIEVAVHMRAFAQEALWRERITRGWLGGEEIDRFARALADFHVQAEHAGPASPWGAADAVSAAGERNLDELAALLEPGPMAAEVAGLRAWRMAEARRLQPMFDRRKHDGMVRCCHGDLHCENILTLDDRAMAFDCIEFDPALRWIDVMHDTAFAVMDLHQRGQPALAARLLNGYLERTGDYAGLAVLRYYMVECALVRAKVALLGQPGLLPAGQPATGNGSAATAPGTATASGRPATSTEPPAVANARRLVGCASRLSRPRRPALFLMHGMSGSGKTTVARTLVELTGAVQVRSDVERRRLPGIDPRSYDRATSEAVYGRLRALAAGIIDAGFPAIIDAAHLRRDERAAGGALAQSLAICCVIVDVRASEQILCERIARRRALGADASEADETVLAGQLCGAEPLSAGELAGTVVVDSEAPPDPARLRQEVERLWRR